MQNTLVVAGGGAAGFFVSVTAARLNPELKVILVEKTGKLLSKVRISGGGRCNTTHACFDKEEMLKKYPRGSRLLKKIFHQFFVPDTIKWFEERGVTLKTEEDGRMFPQSNTSQTIIDCLMKEAETYKVEIRIHHEISLIEKSPSVDGPRFQIHFKQGHAIAADFLCIASGGYPKSSMFEWIQQTGHSIEEPVPSLFTFNIPDNPIHELSGISLPDCTVAIGGEKLKERGPLLITHWGLSGPVVLRLSAWGARTLHRLDYHFDIRVNWMADKNDQLIREDIRGMRNSSGGKKIHGRNPWNLPQRFWEYQLGLADIKDIVWADLNSVQQEKLVSQLCNQHFAVQGKTTFKEEFVTAGGVKISEVDPQSLESRLMPGVFFAGEVLDVDGITGGFNFQHAWTSGFVAGKAIAEKAGS